MQDSEANVCLMKAGSRRSVLTVTDGLALPLPSFFNAHKQIFTRFIAKLAGRDEAEAILTRHSVRFLRLIL